MERRSSSGKNPANCKVENFEEHNREQIISEVRKQQEEKLARIQKDLDNYSQKLTESSEQLTQMRNTLKKATAQQSIGLVK